MTRFCILLTLVSLIGCGGSERPPTAPVSGTVTWNGKPLTGATLGFHLEGEGAPRIGIGTSDDEGHFRLTTYDTGDGAYIGTHTVTVVKQDPSTVIGGSDMEESSDAYDKAMNAASRAKTSTPKQTLPVKYASKDTSPLKVTVEESGRDDVQIVVE